MLTVVHQLTKGVIRLLALLLSRLSLCSCSLSWLRCHGGKVSSIDHFKEAKILIHLELFSGVFIGHLGLCRCTLIFVQPVQSIAIEIQVLNVLEVFFALVLFVLHTLSYTSRCSCDSVAMLLVACCLVIGLGYYEAQCVNQTSLRIVEIWQRDWEIKDVDQLISLIFDCLG